MTEMDSQNNLLICILLVIQIADTTGSKCSDAADVNNLPYIRMCEDGSVTSDRVILDTHLAGESGETTCSCSVDSTYIITIYIEYYGNGLNPNTSGCGSEVVVIMNGFNYREGHYQCNTSPFLTIYTKPDTITWNGTLGGDSKYCLNITGVLILPNTSFTIRCFKPETPMTSPPSSTSPISKIATTTTKFTTGVDKSFKRSTDTDETTMSVQKTTQTNTPVPASSSSFDEKEYVCLPVYALAIIIVSMCLVSLYAVVVTFLYLRRYLNSEKRPDNDVRSEIPNEGGYENMSIPSNTEGTYEGLELSQVNFTPNTYDDLGNSGT